jgi:hypothetical protein
MHQEELPMYRPGIIYTRTPDENQDIFKAWARPDEAFFAAGACHILGHLFFWMHRHEGFKLTHIRPTKGDVGHHMFASNGEWAFDFNGWTREKDLLQSYTAAYKKEYPGWSYEKIIYEHGLFDKPEDHMPPEFFPHLPWERAYKYIQRFPTQPPKETQSH